MESPKEVCSRHGWLRCRFRYCFEVTPIIFLQIKNYDFRTTAVFGKGCPRGAGAPEPCFLDDMGLKMEDIEPFGYDKPVSQNYLNFRERSLNIIQFIILGKKSIHSSVLHYTQCRLIIIPKKLQQSIISCKMSQNLCFSQIGKYTCGIPNRISPHTTRPVST